MTCLARARFAPHKSPAPSERISKRREDRHQIEPLIHEFRGRKVLLDRDLAAIYGVATRRLNEQVRRNRARFPDDFVFQLTKAELDQWKS
jgi:hypothetical protein